MRSYKGNIPDVLFLTILMFSMTLVIVIANILFTSLRNTSVMERLSIDMINFMNDTLLGLDYALPLLYFGVVLISFVASLGVSARPINYAFVFLLVPVLLIFAYLFSEVFKLYIRDSHLDQYELSYVYFYEKYPLTSFMMENLLIITLISFILILVGTYISTRVRI